MCVILDVKADQTLPDAMMEQACDINRDGFGISYVSRGKIHTLRSTEKNDPAVIQKQLSGLKRFRRFVHLRHATVGTVSVENSHPIEVLGKKSRAEIMVMHNGTLYDFRPAAGEESDTLLYVKEFVRPLALRVAAFAGVRKTIYDPFFKSMVCKGVGTSVLMFFDAFGNSLRVNANLGKEYSWGWASNTYSFDTQHHRSSTRSVITYDWRKGFYSDESGLTADSDLPWDKATPASMTSGVADWEKELRTESTGPVSRSGRVPASAEVLKERARLDSQYGHVAKAYLSTQKRQEVKSIMTQSQSQVSIAVLAVPRASFITEAGMKSLEDMSAFTPKELEELCQKYPAAMAQCVIDLFVEWQITKQLNKSQAEKILSLVKTSQAA